MKQFLNQWNFRKLKRLAAITSVTVLGMFLYTNTTVTNSGSYTPTSNYLAATPEIPANNWPITTLDPIPNDPANTDPNDPKKFDHRYPTIPYGTTSADGRVMAAGLQMMILKPELLTKHFSNSGAGSTHLLKNQVSVSHSFAKLHSSPNASLVSTTSAVRGYFSNVSSAMCDGTVQFEKPNVQQRKNPYACGANNSFDCYDLTQYVAILVCPNQYDSAGKLVKACDNPVTAGLPHWVEVWQTDYTLRVQYPKTTNARIESITYNAQTQKGIKLNEWNIFIETVFSADGRFFITRAGHTKIDVWIDNQIHNDEYEIVYAVAPESGRPCDLSNWVRPAGSSWTGLLNNSNIKENIKPIAFANRDSEMVSATTGKKRYGIAEYPMRDTEGRLIPYNKDVQGTYPWIDPSASVMMYETVGANLFYRKFDSPSTIAQRYKTNKAAPTYQVPVYDEKTSFNHVVDSSNTRGISMVGSWTHGKTVLLDGMMNNTDYGVRTRFPMRTKALLYAPNTGVNNLGDGYVELGDGREAVAGGYSIPWGRSINTNFIDSLTNKFNYVKHMQPATARDIVWLMNTGRISEEQAFDDYISEEVVINSDMTASVSYNDPAVSVQKDPTFATYNDGFEYRTLDTVNFRKAGLGFTKSIRLQNAATSTKWRVPKYGVLAANSPGRIEPVALGGVFGKGFWLEPNTSVIYNTEGQTIDPKSQSWTFGLFLDKRSLNDGSEKRLITFSGGYRGDRETYFNVRGNTGIVVRQKIGTSESLVGVFEIPRGLGAIVNKKWSHLGFYYHPSNKSLSFYFNGYFVGSITASPIVELNGQQIVVGGTALKPGVKGWIDEFKLISGFQNLEMMCNYARGTLVAMTGDAIDSAGFNWLNTYNTYLAASHNSVRALLADKVSASEKVVCYTRYDLRNGANLANLPSGTRSLRNAINHPEGFPVFAQARPDSSSNSFCLSCHRSTVQSLSILALKSEPIVSQDDPRRQPSQPLRFIRGIVPVGHFAPNTPSVPMKLGIGQTRYIDEFVNYAQ